MRVWLALLVALGGPARADELVRIGWLRATNDLTLAKSRGTLERALAGGGARVEWDGPFPAAAPAIEALGAGAVDITVSSSTAAMPALASGEPPVVFLYQRLGADAEALLVKDGSPVRAVADLAGHSVAVNRGGTGEYLLSRALQLSGVAPGAVQRVFLGPADAGPAFAAGAVDAWVAWDPFLAVALDRYGARVLADGAGMGSQNAAVMLATRAFATQHRALLQTVFDALIAENGWAVAHPAEAGDIWVRELRLPASMAASLGGRDAVPAVAVGPAQAAELRSVADWYVAAGVIAAVPDLASAVLDLSR